MRPRARPHRRARRFHRNRPRWHVETHPDKHPLLRVSRAPSAGRLVSCTIIQDHRCVRSAYWRWLAYRKPSVTLQHCYYSSPSLPRLRPRQHSVFRSTFRLSRPYRVCPAHRVVLEISRSLDGASRRAPTSSPFLLGLVRPVRRQLSVVYSHSGAQVRALSLLVLVCLQKAFRYVAALLPPLS